MQDVVQQSARPGLSVSAKLSLVSYLLKHYVWHKVQAILRVVKGSGWDLLNWLSGHVHLNIPLTSSRRLSKAIGGLRRWHIGVGGIILYKTLRLLTRLIRYISEAPVRKQLIKRMEDASSYEDWLNAAIPLDAMLGRNTVNLPRHKLKAMQEKAATLKRLRETDDTSGLMWILRQDSARSVGILMRQACCQKAYAPIVPHDVEMYLEEVKAALSHICNSSALSLDERIAFVRELRHAYGRTALVLSGGGSFGHFHFGVVRALLQSGLLPRVVSGSSAGAIGCALLATRTDEELQSMIGVWIDNPNTDFFGVEKTGTSMLKNLFARGSLYEIEEYLERLQRLLGNMTFEQAYNRSGRILNVAVTPYDTQEPPRLLNYLTAPHVIIWSAVAASSAFPWLFKPQDLYCVDVSGRVVPYSQSSNGQQTQFLRRWADGSLEEDLPMVGLSSMFNVNQFLVSQSNPYLIPILGLLHLLPMKLQVLLETEFKHRMGQMLQFWPRNRLLKLLCQPWEGDINFILSFTTFAVHKSAVNFSRDEILKAMKEGQRQVWSKLAMLRSSCAIEVAVDAELKQLNLQYKMQRKRRQRAQVAAAVAAVNNRQMMRRALPSWLHMQALGLQPTYSNDDMYSMADPGWSLDSISELPGAAEEDLVIHDDDEFLEEQKRLSTASGGGETLEVEAGTSSSIATAGPELPSGAEAFKDITALIGLDAAAY